MITQLILDFSRDGHRVASAGTPVQVIEFGNEWAQVELPDGRQFRVSAAAVSSGVHSPEETLSVLSKQSGTQEGTLLKAAQSGRLMARRSGATWFSTLTAVKWAISEGRIRKMEVENTNLR